MENFSKLQKALGNIICHKKHKKLYRQIYKNFIKLKKTVENFTKLYKAVESCKSHSLSSGLLQG